MHYVNSDQGTYYPVTLSDFTQRNAAADYC